MTNQFIFIGGPLDLETKAVGNKAHQYYCVATPDPIKISEYGDMLIQEPSFEKHTYKTIDVNFMGTVRTFYISESISKEEALKRIGSLTASLIDLYASS